MSHISFTNEALLPMVVELPDMSLQSFVAYYLKNKSEIESNLLNHGAVKFRGIDIASVQDFQDVVNSISTKFLSYIDGNSPRTKLTNSVYTSTEYDSTQKITMHNELSYSAKWPNKLFFTCLQPAQTGGETLLADSREILKKMNKNIVSEIEERGIIYMRNLHSGEGMGPSWQDTFETNDKGKLEEYLQQYSIEFEWVGDDILRLKQRSKGIIAHRVTQEKVWFNQIDQFHPSHMGAELYEALMSVYDSHEEFPMYVTFGDGTEIGEDLIKEVLETIERVTTAPLWQRNELLLIDNELVSHGRNPFTGNRKVLVAMSE